MIRGKHAKKIQKRRFMLLFSRSAATNTQQREEKGMKARYMFEVYASEYADQSVVLHGKERLTVYRTYGPKDNDKIEVYAGQRWGIGNGN